MNFETIINDDIANSDDGVCVSVWFNGCDIRCPGCHNEKMWQPKETKSKEEVLALVLDALAKNGVERSLSILGGEPLANFNRKDCAFICKEVRKASPYTYIRVWTGREWYKVLEDKDESIKTILANINELITGPYIASQRTTTMPLVGSSNQERHKFSRDFPSFPLYY